jgi:protein-S-isoprenylcysteine O-methyltransferase Ste14
VQGTTEFHDQIADAFFPQTDVVFDDATARDTAMDMVDPQPTLVKCLVRHVLLSRELLAANRDKLISSDFLYTRHMKPLYRQAMVQGVFGLLFFIALIFVTAGTWDYWQGWVFLAIFAVSTHAFGLYLALYNKPLLERRLKAGPWHEKEWSQKIIVSLVFVAFLAFIVLPILDYRYSLSRVPAWISLGGNAIILVSFLALFWVMKTNSWAASNIRVEADQQVIDTGPYAHVRHPMYAGAIWLFVGIPLALGSWWSVALLIPFFPVLVWRLLDEEKILVRDLPGYTAYMQNVKYRLIPHVW